MDAGPVDLRGRPLNRMVQFVAAEVLQLGPKKELAEIGHDLRETAVGCERNSTHPALVLAHELNMPNKGAEPFPTRKLLQVHDHAPQRTVRLDPRVDEKREGVEVLRTKRPSRLNDHYAGIGNQAMR